MADDELDALLEAPYQQPASPSKENGDSKPPKDDADKKESRRGSRSRSRSRSRSPRRSRSRSPSKDRSRHRRSRSRDRDRSRRRRSRSRDRRDSRRGYRSSRSHRRRSRSRSRTPPRRRRRSPEARLSSPERDLRTIVVMQLAKKCTPRDLEEFFEQHAGKVRDVRMIQDRNSRRPKGIAYVEFVELDSVPKAHTLNSQRLLGVPIMILPTQSEKNRMAAQKAKDVSGPTRLSVANLHPQVQEAQLKLIFEPFGKLVECQIVKTPTGEPSGMATVQFEDAANAQTALEQLNDFVLLDRQIKIGLAAVDLPAPPMLPNMALDRADDLMETGGVPMSAAALAQLRANLSMTHGANLLPAAPALPVAPAVPMLGAPVGFPPAAMPAPISAAAVPSAPLVEGVSSTPTRYLLLQNMFDPDKETDPEWHLDIRDAVLEECSKYGGISHIFVDKNSRGWVYLKYLDPAHAAQAQSQLNGRFFAGSMIVANFFQELVYNTKFADAKNANTALAIE